MGYFHLQCTRYGRRIFVCCGFECIFVFKRPDYVVHCEDVASPLLICPCIERVLQTALPRRATTASLESSATRVLLVCGTHEKQVDIVVVKCIP